MAENYSKEEIANLIDHTFLGSVAEPGKIESLCEELLTYNFACVMVHPTEVKKCFDIIGKREKIGTVIGFPSGQFLTETKIHQCKLAVANGAGELDLVVNQTAVKVADWSEVKYELGEFINFCSQNDVISKVILETCNLEKIEIERLCQIVSELGGDFVKTSTGFGKHGATVEHVALMNSSCSGKTKVKASGGIRNLGDATMMLKAGAARLGSSCGINIVLETSK